ncbi:FUSC family protein [Paeniglutamicibacter cryotolerans]|uniref:Integral membrane bound transporter domain-containing protein n=1 Tax=Paeniglutamicibacter cryotolerans TaxID=670079 RepID=A0A839QHA1_9MICC|nr:FUSC family protein [Paeniglutamicibacter cryotolerans]MBB2995270.1 hypothetical protein [Paeniglutamicibacter cryotolerans]
MNKGIGSLLTLGPGNRDHLIGLRTALGIFVPLVTLLLLDRLDLTVFVVFGAFTGIYGRVQGYGNRLYAQARAGAVFLVVMALAMAASTYLIDHKDPSRGTWTIVGLTALMAGVASVVVAWLRLRPAGSLFHIFAFAAIASLPAQPPVAQGLGTALATIVFSILLGLAGILRPGYRSLAPFIPRRPVGAVERRMILLEGVGYLVAAGLAGSAAALLGPALSTGHPYWAMVAAVVPLVGHTTAHRIRRGLHRVLGTLVGLGLMALIVVAHPPVWALILVIGAAQFAAEMFVTRNYFIAQIFVTPLALVGVSLVTGPSVQLFYDRALETVLGSAIGVLVVLAPKFWWGQRTV